jgi:hypothetical protein
MGQTRRVRMIAELPSENTGGAGMPGGGMGMM